MESDALADLDALLVGVPKAGTTWLANALSQHPGVNLSDPKEPNIIATHHGTFGRDYSEPDWSRYDSCFKGNGMRIEASIHTFACPRAPSRLAARLPEIPMILCLREPVSRTVSHWKMIRDTEEDIRNGEDWADFSLAWEDERLHADSHYARSMERWLDHFPLEQFLILDSQRMRVEPHAVLREVEEFLGLDGHNYNLNSGRHSNSASARRPITAIGKAVKAIFSLIPGVIKGPIVRRLRAKDINIYAAPIFSRKPDKLPAAEHHYSICGQSTSKDLRKFESLTGFQTDHWVSKIESLQEGTINQSSDL
jgi:hypothetical protein